MFFFLREGGEFLFGMKFFACARIFVPNTFNNVFKAGNNFDANRIAIAVRSKIVLYGIYCIIDSVEANKSVRKSSVAFLRYIRHIEFFIADFRAFRSVLLLFFFKFHFPPRHSCIDRSQSVTLRCEPIERCRSR